MRVEIGIGLAGVLIGLALMLTGERMCRTDCWINSLFKMLLPASLESWAGGLPVLVVGLIVIGHAIYKYKDAGK